MKLANGSPGRERLLSLDDRQYQLSYNFELPPLPVFNYVGTLEFKALTSTNHTLAIWRSTFDEAPEDAGRYGSIISEQIFAAGLASLDAQLAGVSAPADAIRWAGNAPAKVYCAAILDAPISKAWPIVRGYAGCAAWLPNLNDPAKAQARQGRVGEMRQLLLGNEPLQEQLVALSDVEHSLEVALRRGSGSTLYQANIELIPVSADDTTLAVCTADWTCSQDEQSRLGLDDHHDMLLRALKRFSSM